jgi:hypothetical protein
MKKEINMSFEFKNKSAKQIADEINAINDDPSQVDVAFKALKKLDAPLRKEAIDALEKIYVAETRQVRNEMMSTFPGMSLDEVAELVTGLNEALQGYDAEISPDDTDFEIALKEASKEVEPEKTLAGAQTCSKVFNKIARIKGNAADPVTKAVVKELDALSPADSQKGEKLIFAMVKGYEKATKQGPRL